jgi:signal transduction histidine kinase
MNARESRRLELLFDMGRLLSSKLDLPDLLKTVLELAAEVVDAETGSLLLLDEAAQELYFDVALGLGDRLAHVRLRLGQGIAGTVAKARRAEIINDVRADARWSPKMDEETGFVTRSILAAPIMVKGRLLGVVEAINKRGGAFDAEDQSAFEAFASQAAVAIENARLFSSLREERFKLETVFSQMQDGAVLTGAAGKVLLSNPAAARLLGSAPRDAAGAFAGLELVPPVAELLAAEKGDAAFVATRREPTLFVLKGRVTRAPLTSGQGRLFVFRDDTEASRQELLKRTFLSLVSHKLKTPVAVVIGFSDLLLSGLDPATANPERYKSVKTIQEQANKVGVLLEKLLRYVAVEDPEAVVARTDVHIDEAVAQAIAGAAARIKDRGARIEAPPSGLIAHVDRQLIVEALKGLIDNAVKFDAGSAPTVTVSAKSLPGGGLELRVADRGPGIPPEAREAVFSKFHQVEKDFTGQQDGMGLGLAYVRRVAELHGGTARLESTLGQGTTVTISLPARRDA